MVSSKMIVTYYHKAANQGAAMKSTLIIIDSQYDFHDVPVSKLKKDLAGNIVKPTLPVTGAWQDALNIQKILENSPESIDELVISVDEHDSYDIAHKAFWVSGSVRFSHPDDYTVITNQDIKDGKWKPVDNNMMEHALDYTAQLEKDGKYVLIIWPNHCIKDSIGQEIVEPVANGIASWEDKKEVKHRLIKKGQNPLTEHYGAFEAEYKIESDSRTHLDTDSLDFIEKVGKVYVCGEALSHCVGATLLQMVDYFPQEVIENIYIIQDATSPVPGFEDNAKELIELLVKKGVKLINHDDI